MARVQITFLDQDDNEHNLVYRIFPSGLANRWMDTVLENQQNPNSYIAASFLNHSKKDIAKIHDQLMDAVTKINQQYRIKSPKFKNNQYSHLLPVYQDSVLDRNQLNNLHALFENWGEEILKYQKDDDNQQVVFTPLHLNFFRLNELIHIYEGLLEMKPNSFPEMSANIDYYPTGIHKPIEPIDKIHLRNCYNWGELYLGYNTLGKDWLAVAYDNDIEVLQRGTVRPQNRFAAEIWLSFKEVYEPPCSFEHWYNSLNDQMKSLVPIHDLSNLALGKYIIGRVMINDYFLQFDSDMNHWHMPNGSARENWNADVFSTFKSVKKIEIMR